MANAARTNCLDNWAVNGLLESVRTYSEARGLLRAIMKVEVTKGVRD